MPDIEQGISNVNFLTSTFKIPCSIFDIHFPPYLLIFPYHTHQKQLGYLLKLSVLSVYIRVLMYIYN